MLYRNSKTPSGEEVSQLVLPAVLLFVELQVGMGNVGVESSFRSSFYLPRMACEVEQFCRKCITRETPCTKDVAMDLGSAVAKILVNKYFVLHGLTMRIRSICSLALILCFTKFSKAHFVGHIY